jgi:hypothetical protein
MKLVSVCGTIGFKDRFDFYNRQILEMISPWFALFRSS